MSTRKRGVRGSTWRLMLLAAAGLVIGCSEHQDPMMTDDGGDVVEVEVRNFEFVPADLHIAPGTTVRWRNMMDNYHTVTADNGTDWEQWQTTKTGETFEVRFDAAGTYPYHCEVHRSLMTGTITVQ
jgi:plastocyanin